MRRSLSFALLTATVLQAQAPAPPAIIRGRVISAESGDPIRNARVGAGDGPEAPAALTDADGRFVLTTVPVDQHELIAGKTGYVKMSLPVSDASEIRLTKAGVITGHVLDEVGDPMPLMTVSAFRVVRPKGRITFDRMISVETDDLGEYRLFGLADGEFVVGTIVVRALTNTGLPIRLDGSLPQHYYPHSDTPEQAQLIRVIAGAEVTGINITMPFAPPQMLATPAPARAGGSGVIEGRVVHADGVPVRRGRLVLMSGDGRVALYTTNTDDDGQYAFRDLPPGSYRATTSGLPSERMAFGQQRVSDRAAVLTLSAGAALEHIDITLAPRSVISGRVLDEYGEPMENALVRVATIEFSKGRRRLVSMVLSRLTDDRGRYRIFGLSSGRYVLSAVVGETILGRGTADWPGYANTYFPGTPTVADAQPVDLDLGQAALNVDIPLVREHIARISGTAYTADGAPLIGALALISSVRSGALATEPRQARTNEDGTFEFARLPAGEYVLQATGARANLFTEGESASQFVTVDSVDVTGLAVRLSAGSTIEGHLTFDGADPPEDRDIQLSAAPADPDLASLIDHAPARADIHDDWTFDISGLNGPRRLQLTAAPAGWSLKTVWANGVDVTDTPLLFGTAEQSVGDVEVVLTKRITTLTVAARGAKNTGAADFTAVAFPTDRAHWYAGSRFFAHRSSANDAAVSFRGLPPGEYYVAATDERRVMDVTEFEDVEFLESLVGGAIRVTLSEGDTRTVAVNVSSR